jgi:hypothetical protein
MQLMPQADAGGALLSGCNNSARCGEHTPPTTVELTMEKSHYVRRYGFECLDRNCCLKPPLGLVVAMVYLCKSLLLPLVIALASAKGSSPSLRWLLGGEQHPLLMIGLAVPALMVLYAWLNRVPTSDAFSQWAWRRGAFLLALSAFAQASLATFDLVTSPGFLQGYGLVWESEDLAALLSIVLHGLVIAYVTRSARARATFADFPEQKPLRAA